MKVKLLVNTFFDAKPRKVGDLINVDDNIAARWTKKNIAAALTDAEVAAYIPPKPKPPKPSKPAPVDEVVRINYLSKTETVNAEPIEESEIIYDAEEAEHSMESEVIEIVDETVVPAVEDEEVEKVEEVAEPEDKSIFDKLTVSDLRKYAEDNKIDLKGTTNKKEILERIKAQ